MARDSDKHAAFRRLATNRTNQALEAIRKIENLANRGNYEYTDEEVEKIFAAIREALDSSQGKFVTDRSRRKVFRL